ncbi:DUF1654 domain-containing protein [Pseudomonas sp. USHLN015]|uniref:DUF1654 domain-containing protein n=1 Tax=Pseudomonas sp. USHLN015 TaxID=3081296 RepID=UPI00301BBDFE
MAKAQVSQPSTFELLAWRVQRLVTSPPAQLARCVKIRLEEGEGMEDWLRLIEDLRDSDGLVIKQDEDGAVVLSWDAAEAEWGQ